MLRHQALIIYKLKKIKFRVLPGGCTEDSGRVGEDAENFQ